MAVRADTSLWIPSAKIMSEQLLPINNQVITTLNDMLIDVDTYDYQGANELYRSIFDIKAVWSSIISDFRLIIANRFGFFGLSEDGLSSRIHNLDILFPQLDKNIAKLESLISGKDLEFLEGLLIPQLKENISSWSELHKKAIKLMLKKDWRKDIDVLHRIETLLEEFNKTFITLRNELTKQSETDIKKLNDINKSLSFFIIILSLSGILIAVLGYLFFDRNILKPIARTTRALLLQSKGKSQELDFHSGASETKDLVEAFNQMSEQIKQRETRLDHMAHHDALTSLPNRLLFNERLEHATKLTERSGKQLVLMLLDLDRFKLINDTLGHLFGDKLLQQTASRLKHCMRAEDTIARLGGDEFAVILENISHPDEINKFANKIIKLFSKPFHIEEQEVHVSTSIGIAMAPLNSSDPTTLIRYADIAMYQSKNMGRNQYTWFSSDLENAEESMINFENKLREAITEKQFEIYYQPLVDANDPTLISSEALLRWNHPEKGIQHPDQFISNLDNSALLFDLTCWVIRESQNFQLKMEKQYGFIPCISVNLPAITFQQKTYRDQIETILLNDIKTPQKFVIEVTEDTLITDMENTSVSLNKLHQKGFRIALDDFGTGQSSLSHLRVFPIDIIKIDLEFIRHVHTDKNDANLVTAIIGLGHDLGMKVVAEGVELQQQIDFLTDRNCNLIQGFYYSKPLPAADYIKYIQQQLSSH
jgi:diguanylate cyclase (GGDEF)-like protein